jgi:hypothetical protein
MKRRLLSGRYFVTMVPMIAMENVWMSGFDAKPVASVGP